MRKGKISKIRFQANIYEGISKTKVTRALRENIYSRIQRDTQRSKALVHITSRHSHHGCRSICSIGTPTYRNRHRRNQRQGRGATSKRLAELRHRFRNADLPGASSTVQRDENHLVRGPGCREGVPITPIGNAVPNHA